MRRVRAEVLNARKLGVYHSITIVAPEVAERVRPGQFLSIGMPPDRAFLLRRHFSIHQASRRGGWAGTLEFVFDPPIALARDLAVAIFIEADHVGLGHRDRDHRGDARAGGDLSRARAAAQ